MLLQDGSEGGVIVSYVLRVRADAGIYSISIARSKSILFRGISEDNPSRTIRLKIFMSRTLSCVSGRTVPFSTMTMDYNPNSCANLHVNISVTGKVYCTHNLGLVTIPALRLLYIPILLHCSSLSRSTLLYPVVSTQEVRICTTLCSQTLRAIHPIKTSVISRAACRSCLRDHPMCFFNSKTRGYGGTVGRPGTHFLSSVRPLTHCVKPLTRGTFTLKLFRSMTCFRPFCLGRFMTSGPGGLLW